MKKPILILILIGLWLLAQTAGAAQESTVISLSGKAWQRSSEQAQWTPLNSGDKVPPRAWVKTGPKSSLRLVAPSGSFLGFSGGKQRRIGASKAASGSSPRFFVAMQELFSSEKRARMAASRGDPNADPNSKAMRERIAEFYDLKWGELIRKPRIGEGDTDLLFETAGFYRQRAQQNRAVALIIKLSQDNPGNEAFARLAEEALRDFGNPAQLQVLKRTGGKVSPLRPGETLRSGDGVQVRFRSETENYLYLYLHTVNESGKTETARIYPQREGAGWALAAEAALELPIADGYFELDETEGREILWGWSCTAPLNDPAVEKAALRRVSQVIEKGTAFNAGTARGAAPPICTQGFAMPFEHR